MTPAPFHLYLPRAISSAVVFSSPHSGRDYPAQFSAGSDLDSVTLRSSEDAYVDQLFSGCLTHGAPLIAACAPRAFVDLNRSSKDLDPAIIEVVQAGGLNPRIAAGLGVIPRVVSEGRPIQSGKIKMDEARARLDRFYYPYHKQLKDMLDISRSIFGEVLLVDCHSMPHEALARSAGLFGDRSHIVIGDRYGTSCRPDYVSEVEGYFRDEGFRTGRNTPFAGAFITQSYGRPGCGQHVLQIEIDRSLYLDEKTVTKSDNFTNLRQCLTRVIARICQMMKRPLQLAAE
ncbi:MAG: N-formylglutamate amidohydrolase [Rhodobacteraceae bacterium]|nr:N-formylglutamate amidohydrolase [Paracoccaceae bacterium]